MRHLQQGVHLLTGCLVLVIITFNMRSPGCQETTLFCVESEDGHRWDVPFEGDKV